ncbi:MAG: S24/S26 family peptidase [Paludibacteraceae bacterium]|nr:S24/S26 family peptidase [Paludibacteraceae bacterium]
MKKFVNNELLLDCADEMLKEGHSVTIRVAGYSMRPILEHRRDDVTLVKPDLDALSLYDVVLFKLNGRYIMHRIIAIDGDRLTLMGDGNLQGCESCTKADVVGIATSFKRNGRTINCQSVWFKRYGKIWNALRPIRRWLLYAYRIQLKLIP